MRKWKIWITISYTCTNYSYFFYVIIVFFQGFLAVHKGIASLLPKFHQCFLCCQGRNAKMKETRQMPLLYGEKQQIKWKGLILRLTHLWIAKWRRRIKNVIPYSRVPLPFWLCRPVGEGGMVLCEWRQACAAPFAQMVRRCAHRSHKWSAHACACPLLTPLPRLGSEQLKAW